MYFLYFVQSIAQKLSHINGILIDLISNLGLAFLIPFPIKILLSWHEFQNMTSGLLQNDHPEAAIQNNFD